MSIAVVWFKRDLRLLDHEPLEKAAMSGLPVLLVYCFEPMLLRDPHYSARHWRFVIDSLIDIKQRIPNAALYISDKSANETFELIHDLYVIKSVYSHQEIGLANTFERDTALNQWFLMHSISWQETPYGAVKRGLTNRKRWDSDWKHVMRDEIKSIDIESVNWFVDHHLTCHLSQFDTEVEHNNGEFQTGGETTAHQVLADFYEGRGQSYAYNLSSPSLSRHHCSRMSAYLAWGNVSLRQVYQSVLAHWQLTGWRRSLVAFSSRLHWHCHFIQKFESECDMEFRHINRGYEDLPRCDEQQGSQLLRAWETGQTGIPMVDACMRCLIHTGYINFRMRAMLVSFLCHHLAIDWRLGVKHLARQFLDFEPGIHYSQFQMQAGVTGINTIRIYNPVKQGEEKDPNGEFVKRWLPEISDIPAPLLHTPWLLSEMEQMMYGVQIGVDYPAPIVELKQTYKLAQDLMWRWRKKPLVVIENQRLLKRHVR